MDYQNFIKNYFDPMAVNERYEEIKHKLLIKRNEIGQLKNQMQQKWNDYIDYWINYFQNLK